MKPEVVCILHESFATFRGFALPGSWFTALAEGHKGATVAKYVAICLQTQLTCATVHPTHRHTHCGGSSIFGRTGSASLLLALHPLLPKP